MHEKTSITLSNFNSNKFYLKGSVRLPTETSNDHSQPVQDIQLLQSLVTTSQKSLEMSHSESWGRKYLDGIQRRLNDVKADYFVITHTPGDSFPGLQKPLLDGLPM